MRPITEPVKLRKQTNCNGPEEVFTEQDFEVEASDVGRTRANYLGYRHATYQFASRDVGRQFRNTSQPSGYTCWSFY
jgi:hypothetical protein